ncbi:MAG: hypothetical protein EB078_00510 [Proteobacteria bacterium]|nr:hypothetical protein [Pseudomonadota bacterium]NDC23565.1 hypothetical protein [Pseudomonadota bacterium]NDD03361.1 hypothetical protein [Pseudomonadota bacterium]NDG25728.1 hypothetical protein [Pseudomonadota bacterium]
MNKSLFSHASLVFSVLALGAFADVTNTRWVSTSPQITELLFQLGKERFLVGTSDQSFYPEKARAIPKIGLLFHPNLESIFAQKPMGVFWDASSENAVMKDHLALLGIKSVSLELNSVRGIFQSIKIIQRELADSKLSEEFRKSEEIWSSSVNKQKSFSFLALAWADPPILFGKNTFLFNLIQEMGGKGILPKNWKTSYPKVSEEWIITQRPEVLIFLNHDENTYRIFKNKCEMWWPKDSPRCTGISAEKFARASLTPILYLPDLRRALGVTP